MELISIHIPKTGGTSFYSILSQVYHEELSKSYRRRDVNAINDAGGDFQHSFPAGVSVIHGHFYYSEIKQLHQSSGAKLIVWLRDPIQRILSRYRFFKALFDHPERNPRNYQRNKHRRDLTFMEYAALPKCQNRMADFLNGAALSDFFFIGIQEHFAEDLKFLAKKLNWPTVTVPFENITTGPTQFPTAEELEKLITWNIKDVALYVEVMKKRQLPYPVLYENFL